MKNLEKYVIVLFLALGLMWSCDSDDDLEGSDDTTPPGALSNIAIQDTLHGGLVFSYNLPADKDIYYAKIQYTRNGELIEQKASYLSDNIKVEGIPDAEMREYTLIAGDLAGNESEPVTFSAACKTPPHWLAYQSADANADFGGALLSWQNESEDWVYLKIAYVNPKTGSEVEQTYKKNGMEETVAFGNFWEAENSFSYYFTDRYDNQTTVETTSIVPKPATPISKDNTEVIYLLGDVPAWQSSYPASLLFDGITLDADNTNNFGLTDNKSIVDFSIPNYVTVKLGTTASITKILRQGRVRCCEYSRGMLKRYNIYGTNEELQTADDPNSVTWQLMAEDCIFDRTDPGLSDPENAELGVTHTSIYDGDVKFIRIEMLEKVESIYRYGRYQLGSEWTFFGVEK